MNRYLTLTCVLLALASGLHAAGNDAIYKWVDDNGEVHYTQLPPQNRKYETLKQASAPADDPAGIRSNLKEQVDAMDKAEEKRAEAAKEGEEQDKIQELRKDNCKIAKKNLANLHQGGNKAFMLPNGEVIRLTDDERQRRIDEANKQIEENCK